MVKKSGLGHILYVGGRNISGDVGAVNNISSPRATIDVTAINKSAVERLLGYGDAQIDFTAFFNDATGQAHSGLSGLPTSDVYLIHGFGETQGDVAAMLTAKQIGYDPTRGTDGRLTIGVQAQGNNVALEWGNLFTAGEDTQASSGATASKDDGASTSDGLAAILMVREIDSGTPTVTIEDSANDSTWATLVAFAAVADGSEPTAERVTVSGTVDRYLRLNVTGTFSNLDYVVAYRRGTAQDDKAY